MISMPKVLSKTFEPKNIRPPSETGKSEDSDITKSQTVSEDKKLRNRNAKPSKDSPTETVIGFKEKYIDSLKYKSPNKRFPQVGIHPDFVKRHQETGRRQRHMGL